MEVTPPAGTPPVLEKPGTRPPMGKSGTRPPIDAQALADKAPPLPLKDQAKPPTDPAKQKKKLLLLVGGLVVVLALGGFFAWKTFMVPPPAPPPPAKPVVKPVAKPGPAQTAKPAAVTPSETLNQFAAMPKAAINKAQDAIAARRGNEQDRVDAAIDGKELPDKRFLDTPLPGHLGGDAAAEPKGPTYLRTESQLAPGIKTTTSELMANAPVSDAFRAFVAAARINGVFHGNPPRALINGRTIRAGEAVDNVLGIVFDGVDAETNIITFKDRTGATIMRRY